MSAGSSIRSKQPLCGARRALDLADDLGQGGDRARRHQGIEDEGRQLAAGHPPGDHVVPADPQDQRDRAEHQQDHRRRQHGPRPDARHGRSKRVLDPSGEAPALLPLAVEGLDRAHRPQGFVHMGRYVGDTVLRQPRQPADPAAVDQDRCQDQRDHQGDQPGQPRRGDDQHHRAAGEQEQVPQEDRDGRADHHLEDRGVGGQPADDLAGLGSLEEPGGEADHPVVDVAPQVGDHPLADPADQEETGRSWRPSAAPSRRSAPAGRDPAGPRRRRRIPGRPAPAPPWPSASTVPAATTSATAASAICPR